MDDSVVRGLYLGADRNLRQTKPCDNFHTQGLYLDLKEHKAHRIRVEEVNEVYAVVVGGERAWFAGLTNRKVVLAGVGNKDHITVPLPQQDEIPDLGVDGQSLLAVYSKTIYHLTDHNWALVHSSDILLPRSGLPPHRHGNMVLLRDEGMMRTHKHLWWLTIAEKSYLHLLGRDMGLFGPIVRSSGHSEEVYYVGPPDWRDTSSYCMTSSGDLWACIADGSFLLRRSKDGSYSIAIAYNSVSFSGDPSAQKEADQNLSVSAVAAMPDDSLLLAGRTGLYRLKGNELVQELAFTIASQSDWSPSNILMLDDQSYVIGSGSRYGVYLLHKGTDGQWNCLPVDESRDTVVW